MASITNQAAAQDGGEIGLGTSWNENGTFNNKCYAYDPGGSSTEAYLMRFDCSALDAGDTCDDAQIDFVFADTRTDAQTPTVRYECEDVADSVAMSGSELYGDKTWLGTNVTQDPGATTIDATGSTSDLQAVVAALITSQGAGNIQDMGWAFTRDSGTGSEYVSYWDSNNTTTDTNITINVTAGGGGPDTPAGLSRITRGSAPQRASGLGGELH